MLRPMKAAMSPAMPEEEVDGVDGRCSGRRSGCSGWSEKDLLYG